MDQDQWVPVTCRRAQFRSRNSSAHFGALLRRFPAHLYQVLAYSQRRRLLRVHGRRERLLRQRRRRTGGLPAPTGCRRDFPHTDADADAQLGMMIALRRHSARKRRRSASRVEGFPSGRAPPARNLWTYHLKTDVVISTTTAQATLPPLRRRAVGRGSPRGYDAAFLGVNNGCDKPVGIEQCGFMCNSAGRSARARARGATSRRSVTS